MRHLKYIPGETFASISCIRELGNARLSFFLSFFPLRNLSGRERERVMGATI